MDPMEMLFDENCSEDIVLYSETGAEIRFRQIAVIPMEGRVYAILQPLMEDSGIGPDEALVFTVDESEGESCLTICEEDAVIGRVFESYYDALRQEGISV